MGKPVLALPAFLLTLLIFGVGFVYSAPQYGTAQPLVTGQSQPVGMAVDSTGTLYWVNWGSGQLLALRKGSTSPNAILSGLNSPQAVGIDALGNLYYSEYSRGTISVLKAGLTTPSVLLSGLSYPNFLSVDAAGNIYFIQGETCGDRISKYDRSTGTVTTLVTAPSPRNTDRGFGGIFIHPSGDLYYTTCKNGTIERLPKGSSTPDVLFKGQYTNGIAVDAERNIFFTDYYTSVSMLSFGSSTPVTIATQGSSRNLLTIDKDGNLYYNDNIGGVIWKIPTTGQAPQQPAPAPQPPQARTPQIVNKVWSYNLDSRILSLKVSGDGKYVVIGAEDGYLYLFDARDGKIVWKSNLNQPVVNIGISFDGTRIVAQPYSALRCCGSFIYLFDQEGKQLWRLPPPGPGGGTISVSLNGKYVAASSDEGVAYLNEDGKVIWSIGRTALPHGVLPVRITMTPDANPSAIVVSEDTKIQLIDTTGRSTWSYRTSDPILSFTLSGDPRYVVAASQSGSVYLLSGKGDLVSRASVRNLGMAVSSGMLIPRLVATPWAANYIVVGNNNGEVRLLDSDLKEISSFSVSSSGIQVVDVSADGRYIAVGSGNAINFFEAPSLTKAIPAPAPAPAPVPQPQRPQEVPKEVPKEVIKEVVKEVPKEVIKEVPKEVIKEVIKEVPKEITREVIKEVPVEVVKTVTVETLGITSYGAILAVLSVAIGVALYSRRTHLGVKKRSPQETVALHEELFREYKEVKPVGEGGFARVYKAVKRTGETVALKIPITMDKQGGRAFLNEISAWRELKHPNIVRIYDFNVVPEPYLEMEYVDGGSLADLHRPLPIAEACSLMFRVAEGIEYAHARGRSHRDIKPKNILMTKKGEPKITDWGLSRISSAVTTATIRGYTPLYAAPEQIDPKFGKADEKTDVYQIGLILYELLSDQLPFRGDGLSELHAKILNEIPVPPSELNPEAKPVDSLIAACLQKKKDARPSITEVKKNLARTLEAKYAESLTLSKSRGNTRHAIYYCSELAMLAARNGDVMQCAKYLADFHMYVSDDLKPECKRILEEVQNCVQFGLPITEGLLGRMDILIHHARME